jgi:hypothetical protein
MNETVEYTYKPKTLILLLCTVFFAACSVVLVQKAMHNDRGAVINRMIELDVQGATIFYLVLAALGIGFVLLGIAGMVKGMSAPRMVRLNAYDISAPKNIFAANDTSILYQDIRDISQIAMNGQVTMIIYYSGGRLSLSRMLFKDKATFEEFSGTLAERVYNARQNQPA